MMRMTPQVVLVPNLTLTLTLTLTLLGLVSCLTTQYLESSNKTYSLSFKPNQL